MADVALVLSALSDPVRMPYATNVITAFAR
jgi:hypothetical protein